MLSKILSVFNYIKCDKNNFLSYKNVFFSKIIVKGLDNKIEIRSKSAIKKINIKIEGVGNILIIENARDIRDLSLVIKGNNCLVYIKENSGIAKSRIVCFGENKKIEVGTNCMIADGCEIWNCDTHSIIDIETGLRINHAGNILIGDSVWIGMHSTILKNSVVGTGSIIGSRSICKNDKYNENSIYAGSPARLIKENVTWSRDLI